MTEKSTIIINPSGSMNAREEFLNEDNTIITKRNEREETQKQSKLAREREEKHESSAEVEAGVEQRKQKGEKRIKRRIAGSSSTQVGA